SFVTSSLAKSDLTLPLEGGNREDHVGFARNSILFLCFVHHTKLLRNRLPPTPPTPTLPCLGRRQQACRLRGRFSHRASRRVELASPPHPRSEEHTSELQSLTN